MQAERRFGRPDDGPRKRVLAISSSGGHWSELLRLAPALEGHDVTWVTTNPGYADSIPFGRFMTIRDASMWNKKALLLVVGQLGRLLVTLRPEVVVTTGAAPGFLAIVLGNVVGARTIWLDSIANAEELSLSGRKVAAHADVWLTQWPHLAKPEGPTFVGSVL